MKNLIVKMRGKVVRFLDIIFENKIFKYVAIYIIFSLILYLFSSAINTLISNNLVIDQKLLLNIPEILIFGVFVFSLIFIIYKITIRKYQPSIFLIHLSVVLTLVYVILKWIINKQGWSFISYSSNWLFIDFMAVLLVLSLLLIAKNSLIQKKVLHERNPFVPDDPILLKDDDKLNYRQRASYIVDYLQRSHFDKSFTIGIVGPWGNGKSSLISLIEQELNENPKSDTIHLKFLPYLNHNETDIISEFFKQLSTEINKYSGRLSNQFLNYSDKLLKTLKNKNLSEFLKPNSGIFNSSSSYDTYNKINVTLNQLNKKYIVFIDDLDRLSNNEVLQILKLVRNTANFKNFIFLIALDKDYVLDSLLVKNDIADHTFVDKFFQLEIYLPEIDKSQLKTDFIVYLKKTDLAFELDFLRDVETCIYKDDNLFDDYISNYRSVKRLVNQLVFDFKTLPDELDTNDLLNFTYLKMTFPYAIKFLNNNWSTIIPYNSKTKLCELIESKKESDEKDIFKSIKTFGIWNLNQKLNINFNDYEISKNINNDIKIEESNHLTKQQNILLVKTLIILFGKENIAESHTSIKFENNLRKLLQQKIQEKDLSEIKFKSIFNIEDDFKNLKELLEEGHTSNILNRIAYFNSIDKDQVKNAILILLYIFNKAEENGGNLSLVWNILSDFISRQIQIKIDGKDLWDKKDKKAIWKYIEEKFIEDGNFKTERKIKFLALISESRIKLDFSSWGTDENTLKSTSLKLYKKLIKEKHNNLWDIYDYSFYHAYHDVRRFVPSDEINKITIDFWSKNDIKLLCAQMIHNDAWTTKMLKTADFANDLFGTKQKYKDFIINNSPEPITPELKEYTDFLELESYTSFSDYIRFEFLNFEYAKKKLQRVIEFNNLKKDEFDNIVEVVFRSSTQELFRITQTNLSSNKISGFVNSKTYNHNNSYYTFIKLETGTFYKTILALLQHYYNLLSDNNFESKIESDNKTIRIIDSDDVIKIISIQPNDYNY